MNLSANTILITGGASGIGLALAVRFVQAGSTVIICGRRADKLAEAWNRLPPATPPISWEANSQYYLAAAHECEHTEQWSGAVWHYSRLIERDARDGKKSAAILWFARATARANLQQWSEAADDANQALTLAQLGTSDQARALALRARGRLDSLREIESGDATEWEKIIADFEQAIKLDDKDRTLRSAAAEACVETFFAVAGESALPEKTRLQHAAKILAAAVAAEPEDARLRQWQAIAELTSGDLDRYRKTCEAMLEHFQNPDARAAGRIAWACLLNETFAKEHIDALLPWTTLAAQTTPSPYVLNTHGAALYRAGKYAEAIDVLTESIRSYDAREKARHQGDARQRGVAYREYKEGKPSEFAGLSGRAIDWVWLAMAHAQVNDMEKARQALERSRTSTEPLESRYLWTRLAIGLLDAEAESLLGANPK